MNTMYEIETTQTVPLTMTAGEAVRVRGTRVNLDTIVFHFNTGASAEMIVDLFPTLALADVYAVIAYYLTHQPEVETYLQRRRAEAEKLRAEIESAQPDCRLIRERLLARAAMSGKV